MRTRIIIGLSVALGAVLPTWIADAEGTVSTYLRDGWEIKAASQISSTGRTQIVLKKGQSRLGLHHLLLSH
jgi:hypothetical protein